MAGTPWNQKESNKLYILVEKEKKRARKVGVKMNWKRIAKKLNNEFNNNRSDKSCFWFYHRNKTNNTPTRTPRPSNPVITGTKYEQVNDPEVFFITATDDEGNIIFNLMVKNTAANVSRMMTEVTNQLNILKDK